MITTTITWDPSVALEQAVSVHCTTTVKSQDKEQVFSMDLDHGGKAPGYLIGVASGGFGMFSSTYWKDLSKKPGENRSELHHEEEVEDKNIEGIAYFHQPHYILTRDQVVMDDHWCSFYGSTSMRWEILNYPLGTYPEQFVQTVYDQTHVHDKIYRWTNCGWEFFKAIDNQTELRRYYQDIIVPLVKRITPNSKEDRVILLEKLIEVPELKGLDIQSIKLK